MSSSRNKIYKYIYITCLLLALIILPLIFNDNFHSGGGAEGFYIFPNLMLIAAVYISAYLDIYQGWMLAYALFYVYGSMTSLNPAIFGLTGTVSYALSYIIWRKIPSDNIISEILITFFVSWIYYLFLFFIVCYRLGVHFAFRNFLFHYGFPASAATALISPAAFFFFKKTGYKNFLKKNKIIYF